MKIQPTKVLSGLRISLPKEFADQIKIGEGDFVGISFSDNKLVVQPIEIEAKK